MSESGEITSRRRLLGRIHTEEDVESIRLDTMYTKRPDQYATRMAKHKIENRKAYDREMKKRKLAISTCESRAPEPPRVRNGPFFRKLEDVPEGEPSGARRYIYPGAGRAFYKTPGRPVENVLVVSDKETEEDEEGEDQEEETERTEDALFVKRGGSRLPSKQTQKPERMYQIKCFHCKSHQLVPRSQIMDISQLDEQEGSTSTF